MSYSITRTKVIRPRRARDLLSRPRLLGMLEDLLDYRLTLIAAPAGYGKTTLLVDFASQVSYPVCWLSLDPLDQDPLRFISYLIAAVSNQFPSFGGASRSLVSNLGRGEIDQEQVLHTLINDLYEHVEEHFALVLDDYHLIDHSAEVNNFINRFTQEVDENCHLVIASRSLLSLPDLPLMIGRSHVKGLSFEELAFHPDEIQDLWQIKYHQVISPVDAREIAAETEGWITGLLLTAETTRGKPTDHGRAARAAGVNLYDYLALQVLDQQSEEMRVFLLRSALLEEFNAGLCSQVLGSPPGEMSWEGLIQELLRMNLFIQPVEDGGTWLRYHHLFGDYLRQRSEEIDPEGTRSIREELVKVYSKKGWWEKAYAVCQQLGDDSITADLLESASSSLLHKGQFTLLSNWLNDQDPKLIEQRPILIGYLTAILNMKGNAKDSLGILDSALDKNICKGELGLQALLLTRRATCQRLLGNYQAGLENALEALALSTGEGVGFSLTAEAEREIGLNQRRLGKSAEAAAHLEASLTIYQDQNDHKNAALVEMDLGSLAMNAGQYVQARSYYQQAFKIWEDLGNLNQLIGLCNNLGVLEHSSGNYSEAFKWFSKALEYTKQSSYKRGSAFTLASLADLALDLGALPTAEDYLAKARGLAEAIGDNYLIIYLTLSQAILARKSGRLEDAKLLLDAVLPATRENPHGFETGKYHLERGQIWLAEDQFGLAGKDFSAAGKIFCRSNHPVEAAAALIFQARSLSQQGESEAAREKLEQAGEFLQEINTYTPLAPLLADHLDSLEALAALFPPDHYLHTLVRGFRDFQSRLPDLQAALGFHQSPDYTYLEPSLEISALGAELVKREGETITAPEWTKQKTVRELFFYLLSQPEGASREEICLVFWPDSQPEQLKKQFKNALYRLRRAVGKDAVLYHQPTRLYHFNRELDYRYDVEEFTSALASAEKESDPAHRIHWFQLAAEYYKHPYVPSVEGIWAEPERYRLYRAYEKALLELAELQAARGNQGGALESSEKLLAVNPGQEAACRIAMRAHAFRGNRPAVDRVFQACRQALSRELDAPLSPQTLSLYHELMG